MKLRADPSSLQGPVRVQVETEATLSNTEVRSEIPSISEVERTFMITSQFLNKETRAQKKADGFPSHSLANPRIGLFSFGSLVTQWCPTLLRPH